MQDAVCIEGLRIRANVGWEAEERSSEQPIELSLRIGCDLATAGSTGALKDTLCYASLRESILAVVTARAWPLLEELASAIVERCFADFADATHVELQIRKFVFPDAAWAGIEVRRERR